MEQDNPSMLCFTIDRLRTLKDYNGWKRADAACHGLFHHANLSGVVVGCLRTFTSVGILSIIALPLALMVISFDIPKPHDALPYSGLAVALNATLAIIMITSIIYIGSYIRAFLCKRILPRLGRCIVGTAMTIITISAYTHAYLEWPDPLHTLTIPILILCLCTELLWPLMVHMVMRYEAQYTPLGAKDATEHARMDYLRRVPRALVWW